MRFVLRILDSVFGYFSAAAVGYFIGLLILMAITFIGGFHLPSRTIPVWLSLLNWGVLLSCVLIALTLRFLVPRIVNLSWFQKIIEWYRERDRDIANATYKPSGENRRPGKWRIPSFSERKDDRDTPP